MCAIVALSEMSCAMAGAGIGCTGNGNRWERHRALYRRGRPVHLFYCNIYKEMVHPLLQETDFEKGVSNAENNVDIGTF